MYIVVLCVQKDRANLNIFFIIGSYGGSWSQYVFHSSQSYLSSAKPSEWAHKRASVRSPKLRLLHRFSARSSLQFFFLSLISLLFSHLLLSEPVVRCDVVESGVHLIYIKKHDRLTKNREKRWAKEESIVVFHFGVFAFLLFSPVITSFQTHTLTQSKRRENAIKILFSFVLLSLSLSLALTRYISSASFRIKCEIKCAKWQREKWNYG